MHLSSENVEIRDTNSTWYVIKSFFFRGSYPMIMLGAMQFQSVDCWTTCLVARMSVFPLPVCSLLKASAIVSVEQIFLVLFHNLESLVFKQYCLSYRMLYSVYYPLLLKDSKLVYSEHFTICISFSFHFAKLLVLLFRLAEYFSLLLVYFIYYQYVFGKREYN